MIIAIDGPAASGKSTTARGVAKALRCVYLDTGAMYRAVTLAVLRAGIDPKERDAIKDLLPNISLSFRTLDSETRIFLGDEDVSESIRGVEVTRHVSAVSALPEVREKMVALQREIAGEHDSVVEGRDVGTVVFPHANFKFFLVADYETRAGRRQKDLEALGIRQTIDEIVSDLKRRDQKDSGRIYSPLVKAEDAQEVDTTGLTIEQQIDFIVAHVRNRRGSGRSR
ncbi:MAG: (d)CMP kinase [Fidelibacterota bacterium]